MRAAWLCSVFLAGAASGPVGAVCLPGGEVSVEEVAARIEREGKRYIFVGEKHAVGPVKRFAVELAHQLADLGHDVGLYVEGFRTDCPPADADCATIARLFNPEAFLTLLRQSRVPVHPIDPPEKNRRAVRMAETVAAGSEAIRIVLTGNTHVAHAGDPAAEIWVYGGGLRYPDPGDLAEAFPREESLTFVLETSEDAAVPYSVHDGGCGADYTVIAASAGAY